ncbi:MAG: DUF5818 domain-containing protein [Acidobacteria bacterium]|nr:DUF5818 domain-containing protein [Acidobacteriota bacterium]
MRKLTTRLLIASFVITLAITSSTTLAQKSKRTPGVEKTLTGYISDASCGLKHMEGMNEKDCTLMCARNGKFVLADRDKKVVYQLDDAGQKKAPEFAGQKVKVTGRLSGKRIRVTAIEAAS